ncbi:MAG: hypothetical protein WCP86_09950, partial [bacterium]
MFIAITYHSFTSDEFGFADADAGDKIQAIKITSLPVTGELLLNGSPVLVNQIISVDSFGNLSGDLRFVPVAYATGASPYDTFQFKVSDGVSYSAAANTMSINVYPRIDGAATLLNVKFYHAANGDATYTGAGAIGLAGDGWNNIDATSDGNCAHRVNTALINNVGAATGARLVFNQANWDWDTWGSGNYTTASGYPVTIADSTYDLMRSYIHNCNMSLTGLTPGRYNFYVYSVANRNNLNQNTRFWVNAGNGSIGPQATTANLGGAPLVANRDYVVFNNLVVSAAGTLNFWWDSGEELLCGFQLAPVASPAGGDVCAVSMMAGTPYVFKVSDFDLAGLDAGSLSASIKVIAPVPTTGTLSFDGTPVTADQVIGIVDINAGKLTFAMASAGSDSFTFQVSNDGVSYSANDTMNVTAVAPMGLISAKYRHSNEGDSTFSGAAVLGTAGDQWNDIDDNGFNGQAHTYSPIIDVTGTTVPGITFQTLNGYWGGCYWGDGNYNANNYNVNSGSSVYYDLLRSYFGDVDQRVTGLTPGALYDLVVYLHTQDNRALAIWVNGTVKYGTYNLTGAPLVANRDYIAFSGIAADSSGNIRWYRQDWNEGRWSGFQLRSHVAGTVTGASGSKTIALNAFQ